MRFITLKGRNDSEHIGVVSVKISKTFASQEHFHRFKNKVPNNYPNPFRTWYKYQIDEMGLKKWYPYNRTGGIVIGVIEIVLGLIVFILQIKFFTQDGITSHLATGVWSGLYVSKHCSTGTTYTTDSM